jgi:hypothetical protein
MLGDASCLAPKRLWAPFHGGLNLATVNSDWGGFHRNHSLFLEHRTIPPRYLHCHVTQKEPLLSFNSSVEPHPIIAHAPLMFQLHQTFCSLSLPGKPCKVMALLWHYICNSWGIHYRFSWIPIISQSPNSLCWDLWWPHMYTPFHTLNKIELAPLRILLDFVYWDFFLYTLSPRWTMSSLSIEPMSFSLLYSFFKEMGSYCVA